MYLVISIPHSWVYSNNISLPLTFVPLPSVSTCSLSNYRNTKRHLMSTFTVKTCLPPLPLGCLPHYVSFPSSSPHSQLRTQTPSLHRGVSSLKALWADKRCRPMQVLACSSVLQTTISRAKPEDAHLPSYEIITLYGHVPQKS